MENRVVGYSLTILHAFFNIWFCYLADDISEGEEEKSDNETTTPYTNPSLDHEHSENEEESPRKHIESPAIKIRIAKPVKRKKKKKSRQNLLNNAKKKKTKRVDNRIQVLERIQREKAEREAKLPASQKVSI